MELIAEQRDGVEAHLRQLGWIGDDETLDGLEVPGEGNMNRTLRARVTGARRPPRTLILKQAVPYVAKYPQIAAPVDRLAAEAAFYRAIAGSAALEQHTPALLGEDPDTHLLCLEDLGEGGDLTRLYGRGGSERNDASLAALLDWLSALHAIDAETVDVPDNRAMRELNHAHIFEIPFAADNGVALSDALRDEQARLAGDRGLQERARDLGERYLGHCEGTVRALLHGDFYPGSWLDHPTRTVAVIDPEFAFVGPPEFDVGVFSAHLILSGRGDVEVRRQLAGYRAPRGFGPDLARAFAGIEVIRRLLGVAQLPLDADDSTRLTWLHWAREAMTT
ncbi:MAG: phosphotransferase [Pseudomonadales bacterium]